MNTPNRTLPGALLALSVALAAAALTSACAPLAVGGAMVGGALVAVDRRTAGAVLEDEGIELKATARARQVAGDNAHIAVTSYNRLVLLTGEVGTDADRRAVEQAIARVENVRSIVNDLGVMPASSLTERSNDLIITGKVRATFIDASDVQSNNVKVVTERGVTYLMGRLTEREATRVVELARQVSGVRKVVRVFELLTEQELAELRQGAGKTAPTTGWGTTGPAAPRP